MSHYTPWDVDQAAQAIRQSPNGAWTMLPGPVDISAGFATAVLDAVAPAIVARAKAEALREAADDMRLGWGDLRGGYYGAIHIPDDAPPSARQPLKAWLYDRADEIEQGES